MIRLGNRLTGPLAGVLFVGLGFVASAQNSIAPGVAQMEYPSYQTLSIKLPVTGDDNRNAVVNVRYRLLPSGAWANALPLLRVMPETVLVGVEPQFAGSIFDLRPGSQYAVELTIQDPDGGSAVQMLNAQTRTLPVALPAAPRVLMTSPTASGASAFGYLAGNAMPGDVITLQEGVYNIQEYWIGHSGTPENPIIIRGVNRDKVILDGGSCTTCIMFALRNDGNIIFEDLTIRNIGRAFRIVGNGSNYVFRRIRTTQVDSPVYASDSPTNVTVMDSVFDGPSTWPSTYASDPGHYNEYNGVALGGSGHVVAHNRFQGFGDSVKFLTTGHRGQNVYGNDFYDVFDNAIELDLTGGNSMAYRNRITNAYMPLSIQPAIGGPAYFFRNTMNNVVFETIKDHAVYGSQYSQSSGVLAYHNTAVNTNYVPLGVETADATHNFEIKNNIFLGRPDSPYSLSWGTAVDHGLFDYNLYYPDSVFWWRNSNWENRKYANLAGLKASGEVMERNGLIGTPAATLGLQSIPLWQERQRPKHLTLASGSSPAVDKAQRLYNINDGYMGNGPDLGAHEYGCVLAWYGPRPKELTEANQLRGCEKSAVMPSGSAVIASVDTTTKGNWKGRYGSLGQLVAGDPATPMVEWTPITFNAPGTTSSQTLQVTIKGKLENWGGTNVESDVNALQWTSSTTGRSRAAWTSYQDLVVDVQVPTDTARQVAMYFAEWPTLSGPNRKIEIWAVDSQHRVLAIRTLENLTNGTYVVWNVKGQVRFRILDYSAGGSGAFLNGVFFGTP